jgi:enamine deaminase RidA (YjgF/YER057c/UK114 family)
MLTTLATTQLQDLEPITASRIERRPVNGRQEVRVRRVTGFDRGRGGFPRRLSEQCRQALANGAQSLEAIGLSMHDVIRVVYLVHDADAFPACFPFLRDAFGSARPAVTMRLVGGFDTPDVKIEIELIARGRVL